MARFRLARPAQIDLANILATSAERWGSDGRQRYAAVLAGAMRQVADDPEGPLTKERPELRSGIRSFHVRHARRPAAAARVRRPVHVLYYRVDQEGVIEIVRVLHDKMDPSRYLDEPPADGDI
ncbi:MAG: type II toxin-antitoxin system RelE/ParE family toxin [Vicinamibacterales bacterium]